MKKTELLALGTMAITRNLFDIRLRAAYLAMQMMEKKKDESRRAKAEEYFCKRTRYLVLTGVIEVARPKQARRRAA